MEAGAVHQRIKSTSMELIKMILKKRQDITMMATESGRLPSQLAIMIPAIMTAGEAASAAMVPYSTMHGYSLKEQYSSCDVHSDNYLRGDMV